jgi:hypothetical protein
MAITSSSTSSGRFRFFFAALLACIPLLQGSVTRYSKSIDQASSISDIVDPFNYGGTNRLIFIRRKQP